MSTALEHPQDGSISAVLQKLPSAEDTLSVKNKKGELCLSVCLSVCLLLQIASVSADLFLSSADLFLSSADLFLSSADPIPYLNQKGV